MASIDSLLSAPTPRDIDQGASSPQLDTDQQHPTADMMDAEEDPSGEAQATTSAPGPSNGSGKGKTSGAKGKGRASTGGGVKERGVSSLPIARVQRIIKADKEVDMCNKEAVFLISCATEIFIRQFADAGYANAQLDKRKVVQYRDLSKAVEQTEEYDFLEEVIPKTRPLSEALAERSRRQAQLASAGVGAEDESGGARKRGGASGLGGRGGRGGGKEEADVDEGVGRNGSPATNGSGKEVGRKAGGGRKSTSGSGRRVGGGTVEEGEMAGEEEEMAEEEGEEEGVREGEEEEYDDPGVEDEELDEDAMDVS